MTLAIVLGFAAAFLNASWMAEWFSHPQYDHSTPADLEGVRLLRLMLMICAFALLVLPWCMQRVSAGEPDLVQGNTTTQSSAGRITRLILPGLIIIALLLRMWRASEGLWYDEIAAWISYGQHGPGTIIGNYLDPSNHILHTLLSWWSVEWLTDAIGSFEFALRLPALLASVATVPAMYALMRELRSNETGDLHLPLLAAGLGAVLPIMVLEGAEARGYSLMMLASVLLTWLMLRAVRVGLLPLWLVYAAIAALGVWAHLMTVFVVIGHAICLAWFALEKKQWRSAIVGWLAIVLAAAVTIMLYAPALPSLLDQRAVFATVEGDEPRIFGPEGWHLLLQIGGSWYWWAALPGWLCAVLGGVVAVRDTQLRWKLSLLWMGLPLLILAVIIVNSWLYARFALFMMPGVIVLIALGLDAICQRSRVACVVAALAITIASAADFIVRPPKQPLREAMQFVDDAGAQRVLAIGLAHRVAALYQGAYELRFSLWHGRELEEDLRRFQPDWIVLYYPNHITQQNYNHLHDAGFVLEQRFDGWVDWADNGDVLVYRQR